MRADNESADTFSFALVLLCLAVGDIRFVQVHARLVGVSMTTYALGWRPKIPPAICEGCQDLAMLILAMWARDFRERPPLRDVVSRLEATSMASLLDGVRPNQDHFDGAEANAAAGDETPVNAAASLATIADLRSTVESLTAKCARLEAGYLSFEATVETLKAENGKLVDTIEKQAGTIH